MTIRKEPSGRFRAVLKSGRTYIEGRTFTTKREAQAWLARERAAMSSGIDPRAGRPLVRTLLPLWLVERRHSVSAKTYIADAALPRLVPTALAAMSIGAVSHREVTRALVVLSRQGLAEASVRRFRASLSAFFAWAVRERLIGSNPVTATRVPKASSPRAEMFPLNEAELELMVTRAAARNQRLADILLVDAWTGLRWSELRAPSGPRLRRGAPADARRAASGAGGGAHQGDEVGEDPADAGGRPGAAPSPSDGCRPGRGRAAVVTDSGSQLHASAFKRTLDWTALASGRRIHDLRHTAACLWLARGVDPVTVQARMGHASIATTNLYLHHLGTSADRAGLDRLNAAGHARGTRQGPDAELQG